MFRSRKTKFKKGFTLIETLVAITVFGIVSVVMSAIVLRLLSFSIYTDRRNDFLNEIDNSVNNMKNEMRNAEYIGACTVGTNPGPNRPLFIRKKKGSFISGKQFMQLNIEQGTNRVVWVTLAGDPSLSGNVCTPADQAVFPPEYLASTSMDFENLTVNIVGDSSSIPNYLTFVSFDVCDDSGETVKVFDCTGDVKPRDPYKYMFAISTRNF